MLDPRAIRKVVELAISERHRVERALRQDTQLTDQEKHSTPIVDESDPEGFASGFLYVVGKTRKLLYELQPQVGTSAFALAYQQANADAMATGLGAFLLPKLEAVRAAHIELHLEARLAYENSTDTLETSEAHSIAVIALRDIVRLYGADVKSADMAATSESSVQIHLAAKQAGSRKAKTTEETGVSPVVSVERAKGFEPSTYSLGSCHSAN